MTFAFFSCKSKSHSEINSLFKNTDAGGEEGIGDEMVMGKKMQ